MIVVGENISSTKIKVEGCFIQGSQVVEIEANTPPNPPEDLPGKDSVMFLDTETNTLYWDYVDRPLTEMENIQLKLGLAQKAIDDLVLGGMF